MTLNAASWTVFALVILGGDHPIVAAFPHGTGVAQGIGVLALLTAAITAEP